MTVLSPRQIATLAANAGFPKSTIPLVVGIALAESGGNPDAINNHNANGSVDHGLMQINSVHSDLLSKYNWRDPAQNMKMAYLIYKQAGDKFTPWSTYNSGAAQAHEVPIKGYAKVPPSSANSPAVENTGLPGLGGITDSLSSISHFFSVVTNPELWKRIGYGSAAIVIIILGFLILARKPIGKAATVAAKGAIL